MGFTVSSGAKRRNNSAFALLSLQFVVVFVQLIALTCAASSFEKDLTLTYNQKLTLDKFKQRMANRLPHDYMKQDIYLMRWLRARNFNIDQAEQMLNENTKWRKANKMDKILDEDWTEFQEKYPYYLDTSAKDGKPIQSYNFNKTTVDLTHFYALCYVLRLFLSTYWKFWRMGIRAMSVSGRMSHLIRYLDKGMEDAVTTVRKLQEQGKKVTRFEFLVNMDNYNVVQHGCLQCISFYLGLISSYENHFPITADHIILFNTPPVFEVILRVIRPLMSPITRQSLQVYGQDKAAWSKVLLGLADKNQLSAEYGGTYKRQE